MTDRVRLSEAAERSEQEQAGKVTENMSANRPETADYLASPALCCSACAMMREAVIAFLEARRPGWDDRTRDRCLAALESSMAAPCTGSEPAGELPSEPSEAAIASAGRAYYDTQYVLGRNASNSEGMETIIKNPWCEALRAAYAAEARERGR